MTIILSNADVSELVTMPECIAVLEQAYRHLAAGNAIGAVSSEAVAPTAHPNSVYQLKSMSGVMPEMGVSALRLSSDIISFENNRQFKVPLAPGARYTGLILLFSTETGEPLAIFPDGILQRMRVGATSALGARYMARSDSHTVGLLGAGGQAGTQVKAITSTYDISSIKCYSPNQDKCKALCEAMSLDSGVPIQLVQSPVLAVKNVDIVLCATNSSAHVFSAEWHEPGMHVGTIRGAELGPDVIRAADVVAIHDRRLHGGSVATKGIKLPETWLSVAGMPELDQAPTLADLISGKAQGRKSPEEKSCFVNVIGIGLQFAAVGALFYRKALESGRGNEVPTDWLTEDVVP